ncbi:MAG TPA: hypothetical protein VJL10_09500 [Anaerolineales bacterium]|nr:hypothetical protein [Anaerolineales bacterium]
MTEGKRFSLVKPTVNTPFHVDFQWWKKNERDWHVYLRSLLCTDHQEAFSNVEEGETIDWVDPVTAEVKPMDGIQNAVITHCVKQPGFLTEQTALVEAVFRLFLTNGNIPMTSQELGTRLNRAPETILRTLAGPRVYKGLRPFSN